MINCVTCGKNNLQTSFYKNRSKRFGYNTQCKLCVAPTFKRKCPNCLLNFLSKKKNPKTHRCFKCSRKNNLRKNKPSYPGQSFRDIYLINRFGITLEFYEKLFIKQLGCCAICKRHQEQFKRKLAVDHCHKTKKIRGLLCMDCNVAIGNLKDNPQLCLAAAKYLETDVYAMG